jgi:hypothetical protein
MTTLGEMVPAAAWPELERLIATGRTTARDFLPMLLPHRAEMEANGVLPEYCAYAIEYAVSQTRTRRGT